ncbi:recombinase [Bacteroides thetaiotaomicron]|nr:recombinase [Bacteroides thetaiotaomicron]
MLRATDKITALYCRLSVEDMKEDKKGGKEDVSNSIQNQKMILLQYAKENRFPNPTFFVDDGYSGTNFDRPGFQAMLAEIEAGRVAVCITKDDCVIIEPTQKDLENQGFVAGSICF